MGDWFGAVGAFPAGAHAAHVEVAVAASAFVEEALSTRRALVDDASFGCGDGGGGGWLALPVGGLAASVRAVAASAGAFGVLAAVSAEQHPTIVTDIVTLGSRLDAGSDCTSTGAAASGLGVVHAARVVWRAARCSG